MKKVIVVKHMGREEIAADGTCSKSPPLKRLCQDVQVCSWGLGTGASCVLEVRAQQITV